MAETKTSQNIVLKSTPAEVKEIYNAPAIVETSPEDMPDPAGYPVLTDCQPILSPVINQHSEISKESMEEEGVAPNDDVSHLTRAHDSRNEIHRESNEVQNTSRPKTRSQFKKTRQISQRDVAAKYSVDGEKQHKCELFQYITNLKGNLTRHMRIHTGEKPFKCNKCNYTTAQHINLIQHERTHTGEKPFKCRSCEYAAARSGDLNYHVRIHTGEKPYKCRFCQFATAHHSNLSKHNRIHTGAKPYKCRFCEFASGYGHSLNTHVRTQHKDVLKLNAANNRKNTALNMVNKSGRNDEITTTLN